MDDSGGKSYSRARGRIAGVLADARASLMEPSRPFTPASLDQRTSLTNINSLDKHGNYIALGRLLRFWRVIKIHLDDIYA